MDTAKRCTDDFIFYRIIGEGSFSVVYLAKDIQTKSLCAVKVCEKSHIYREKMQKAILREKQIMKTLADTKQSLFIIKLLSSFQDDTRLFFVLNYCVNGELLSFINQREIFDEKATLFYAAEILLALEYLHRMGIFHRDLKPENILLNEKMHIQITDFGSAFFLYDPEGNKNNLSNMKHSHVRNRKNSFVGTAQYVSPEMLSNKKITGMCDLWAFACIIFQMITNAPPFRGGNEYIIFQKINQLDYKFPENFPSDARDLIESILKLDADERLGAQDNVELDGYISIRQHDYFKSLNNDWDLINKRPPDQLLSVARNEASLEELKQEFNQMNLQPGLNEKQITRLLCLSLHEESDSFKQSNTCDNNNGGDNKRKGLLDITPKEMENLLKEQKETNKFHQFVENNLIIKQGLIDKKKGFFPRRRMFLLTTGPHLYYIDPANMVLKGEIPFCKEMRTEAKNFRNFYVHVPNRTYILEDTSNNAPGWCEAIDEVKKATFNNNSDTESRMTNTTTNNSNSTITSTNNLSNNLNNLGGSDNFSNNNNDNNIQSSAVTSTNNDNNGLKVMINNNNSTSNNNSNKKSSKSSSLFNLNIKKMTINDNTTTNTTNNSSNSNHT